MPHKPDGQDALMDKYAKMLGRIANTGEGLAAEVQGGWGEAIVANPDVVRGGTGTMEVRIA